MISGSLKYLDYALEIKSSLQTLKSLQQNGQQRYKIQQAGIIDV